ncbi:hypothetical protein BDZ89DRAFT_195602 [Hymenopellis radicata]|nr:hypothetical protein BDZ89DRAFT_195602 [Hymenopellis radicata]
MRASMQSVRSNNNNINKFVIPWVSPHYAYADLLPSSASSYRVPSVSSDGQAPKKNIFRGIFKKKSETIPIRNILTPYIPKATPMRHSSEGTDRSKWAARAAFINETFPSEWRDVGIGEMRGVQCWCGSIWRERYRRGGEVTSATPRSTAGEGRMYHGRV